VTGTNAATFGYSYDPAGRLLSAVSMLNDTEHPATLFQAQSYNAVELTSAYYGLPQGSSTPAFSQALSYDTRTRLITEADSTPAQPNLYNYAVAYDGDSNVVNLTDSLLGTWTYTPDNLDRLTTAVATAGTYNGLTLTESYDAYGNRENQVPTGSYGGPVPSPLLVTFNNGKNRVDQWAYDAAGDVINDGASLSSIPDTFLSDLRNPFRFRGHHTKGSCKYPIPAETKAFSRSL
jgi:hypothetical protein